MRTAAAGCQRPSAQVQRVPVSIRQPHMEVEEGIIRCNPSFLPQLFRLC